VLLIPVEDVLQVSGGTLLKYMAIVIIILSAFSNRYIISDSLHLKGSRNIYYLFFLGCISVFWALDFSTAYSSAIKSIMLMGFTLVAAVRMDCPEKIKTLENVIIIGGLISVVYILATQDISQIMQQESISAEAYRITTSTASDANGSAARLLLSFAISTWRCIDKSENAPRFRLLYLLTSLILAIFMLLTGSRTAVLSILAVIVIYVFFNFQHSTVKNAIIIILLCIIIYNFVSQFMPDKLFNRMFSVQRYDVDTESNSRTRIWNSAFQYVLPNMPFWGFGIGNAPVAMYSVSGYYQGIHNTYLTMFMEFGFFGIPVFAHFLLSMLKKMFANRIVIGLATMVGMMIVMMFIDVYRDKFIWVAFMYFMALINTSERRSLTQ
jgi:O-antigen ligase